MSEFLDANRAPWDEWADLHAASGFYDLLNEWPFLEEWEVPFLEASPDVRWRLRGRSTGRCRSCTR